VTGDEQDIYKDLTYTQNAYYLGEQIFPLWENVYAVLVSAFFIAYFTSPHINYLIKLILIFIGLIFSICWFLLVSRNQIYSEARANRLKELEKALRRRIDGVEPLMLFTLSEKEQEFVASRKSCFSIRTWCLRKLVPMSLVFIWIIILIMLIASNVGC